MRTLIIGDIHGGLRALIQVLNESNYNKKKDKLIFLGDYVDGWSESSETIEYLIELRKNNENIIFIKGNHDKWCQNWLNDNDLNESWISQGGRSTLDSYKKNFVLNESLHKEFFNSLLNYYVDSNNLFVHGGYEGVDFYNQFSEASYYWDRSLWKTALSAHSSKNVPNRMKQFNEIFIGHTSTLNSTCKPHFPEYNDPNQINKNGSIIVPMNRCNVWNLDTGAGFKGKLTIMDLDTKEYWQSDYLSELYSEETGR